MPPFADIFIDIEFAWDGEKIWIVQARPITVTNINNNNITSDEDICSHSETYDVFPDTVTPMTWCVR